jgi:hypothetical protein
VGNPWRALVAEVRCSSYELRITVGRQIDRGEGLVIQGVGERERDVGYRIIAMIADVCSAWHDSGGYLAYRVMIWRRAP